MPTRTNKFLITAGIITLIQAAFQTVYTSFAIAQYFCWIDFLRGFPLLIYIRILYFHNPDSCGARVNIGESIDELADQAFVLIQRVPFTTERTFIINCINLGLSIIWVIGSILLIKGGTRKHHSNHTHWPWLMITLAVTLLDVVAVISYANDSFHTQTLDRIMQYINGSASGIGNLNIYTEFAAWLMVLIYSRFVILLLVNAILMIYAIVDCTRFRSSVTSSEIERNQDTTFEENSDGKESDEVTTSSPSVQVTRIPRPGLSQSFRTMKNYLFNRTASLQAGSNRTSINGGRTRNRAVNFPEEIEMPPALENMIAEQQRRLDLAMVDTSGRRSPGQGSRLTHAHSFNNLPETSRGRRGTAVELQGQMPWSYMPASANRMRDQLPPDEDLPPVPLPDYTAIQSARKASVHRAASSLSSITPKKEYNISYQSPHQEPTSSRAGEATETTRREVVHVQADASKEALQPDLDEICLDLSVPMDAFEKASLSDTGKYKDEKPIMKLINLLPTLRVPPPPPPPRSRMPLPPPPRPTKPPPRRMRMPPLPSAPPRPRLPLRPLPMPGSLPPERHYWGRILIPLLFDKRFVIQNCMCLVLMIIIIFSFGGLVASIAHFK